MGKCWCVPFTSEVGAGSDVIPERYVGFSAYEHDACSQLEIGQRGCVRTDLTRHDARGEAFLSAILDFEVRVGDVLKFPAEIADWDVQKVLTSQFKWNAPHHYFAPESSTW